MALRAFASVRMQLFPGVGIEMSSRTENTARATRVGAGIDWTRPSPFGSIDAFVVSHWSVFWVISTTKQGGPEHLMARVSRDRTVPQLSPATVTRHTLAVGIVNPFNKA